VLHPEGTELPQSWHRRGLQTRWVRPFEHEDEHELEYEAPTGPPFPNAKIPYPRSRIRRAEI
jgi:hypothetical protein